MKTAGLTETAIAELTAVELIMFIATCSSLTVVIGQRERRKELSWTLPHAPLKGLGLMKAPRRFRGTSRPAGPWP